MGRAVGPSQKTWFDLPCSLRTASPHQDWPIFETTVLNLRTNKSDGGKTNKSDGGKIILLGARQKVNRTILFALDLVRESLQICSP